MKKALIITYYWPPAATAGVYRVLKFAKYLEEFGWLPVVLTVRDGSYQAIDNRLNNEVPSAIKIYKSLSLEPMNLYKKVVGIKDNELIPTDVLERTENNIKEKLAKYIRLNFFVPDARIGWIPCAVADGIRMIRSEEPQLIFSTSPPPTVHLIAFILSKLKNLPWVADFRDPWVDFYHYENSSRNKLSLIIDQFLEHVVLKKANVVTSVNSGFFKTNSFNDAKHHIIPNGFDPDDLPRDSKKNTSEKFTILYAGTLKMRRYVDSFFRLLKELSLHSRIRENFQIKFIGLIDNQVKKKISEIGVGLEIKYSGFLNHDDAIKEMTEADLLLLIIDKSDRQKHVLTGKLFEYLMVKKPILAYGPDNGSAAKILEKTGSGKIFLYDDKAGPKNFILDIFREWETGEHRQQIDLKELNKYNRIYLTERLSNIFDSIT